MGETYIGVTWLNSPEGISSRYPPALEFFQRFFLKVLSPARIPATRGSAYGSAQFRWSRCVNRSEDTKFVQDLLNRQKNTAYNYGHVVVDRLVGPQTIGAIKNYQSRVVGFANPDGRVDPGYQTIANLEKHAAKTSGPSAPPRGD